MFLCNKQENIQFTDCYRKTSPFRWRSGLYIMLSLYKLYIQGSLSACWYCV